MSHFSRNKHVWQKTVTFSSNVDYIAKVNISPILTFFMLKIDIFAQKLTLTKTFVPLP